MDSMVLAGWGKQSDSVMMLNAQSWNPMMSPRDILRVPLKIWRMLLLGGGWALNYIYCNTWVYLQSKLQHHSVQYPTLSSIARDYLAIKGSATPSERAFSSGGTTGTAKHNCLTPKAFEALQLLKSAYCNRHIAADKEAHKHSISIIDFTKSNKDVPAGPKWKGKGCISKIGNGMGEPVGVLPATPTWPMQYPYLSGHRFTCQNKPKNVQNSPKMKETYPILQDWLYLPQFWTHFKAHR